MIKPIAAERRKGEGNADLRAANEIIHNKY
jgi:hypothetical protein